MEARQKKATPHDSRNLFLFALVVAVALISLIRYRHRSQSAAATKLALSALHGSAAASTLDGTHPCMLTVLSGGEEKPVLTRCATPTTHKGGMDQFEVDLRYGAL